jgi:catechol 2,3-dioxygenase-like lactoylglutathione lyase family enzyme
MMSLPTRLHYNAYVVKDQQATRRFYEDIVGLPLVACWTEVEEMFGAVRSYCHTFFGLGDGSGLAFFQFADPADHELFAPQARPTPFVHLALKTDEANQTAILARLRAADWPHLQMDHGYCRSLYATDPHGLNLEFTVDHPDAAAIDGERRRLAAEDLARWLSGDHRSNNAYRHDDR